MRNKGTCIKHGELKTLAQNSENKRHTSHWELKGSCMVSEIEAQV